MNAKLVVIAFRHLVQEKIVMMNKPLVNAIRKTGSKNMAQKMLCILGLDFVPRPGVPTIS